MASLYAQKNLNKAQGALSTSVERLSSGLRINAAKDDSAGLGISQKLASQVKAIDQSIRNSNDAISMIQTAEGAANEVSNILLRLKELAVQGNNGALDDTQRGSIAQEAEALTNEIDAIAARTSFNGQNLIDGSMATVTFQTGFSESADVTSVDFSNSFNATSLGVSFVATVTTAGSYAGVTQADFVNLATEVETAIDNVNDFRGRFGAIQNRLSSAISNLTAQSENLTSARSRVTDTDYAAETAQLTKGQILQQAATAMLAQANQMPNVILSLLK
jgi:flagellin